MIYTIHVCLHMYVHLLRDSWLVNILFVCVLIYSYNLCMPVFVFVITDTQSGIFLCSQISTIISIETYKVFALVLECKG